MFGSAVLLGSVAGPRYQRIRSERPLWGRFTLTSRSLLPGTSWRYGHIDNDGCLFVFQAALSEFISRAVAGGRRTSICASARSTL